MCLLDQSERGLYLMPNSGLCSLSMCLNCSPMFYKYGNCKQSIGSLEAAPRPYVRVQCTRKVPGLLLIVDNIIAPNYSFQSPIILNQLLCGLCTCVQYVYVFKAFNYAVSMSSFTFSLLDSIRVCRSFSP